MLLHLIRHGETPSNQAGALDTGVPGPDLTDQGRDQAAALVGRFQGIDLDAIYVSTLVRTHQTAAPLAQARGLVPTPLAGLREVSAGDWEMRTDREAITGYLSVVGAWLQGETTTRMAGGETGEEFLARFDGAVEEILGHDHRAVAVFSHGAAIRTWVAHRCDLSAWSGAQFSALPNTGTITLEGDATGWTVMDWTPLSPDAVAAVVARAPASSD